MFYTFKNLHFKVVVDIFINMEDMFESYDAIFEVYIEDKLTNRQQMQAPKEMLMVNFIQTAKQIQNDKRPITITMIVPNIIWDDFEQKQKVLNNEAVLSNHAMVAWEREKQND